MPAQLTPKIAVFDSGVGGTSVLGEIRSRMPMADLIYVADHAFGAYGERSLDDVRERTEVLAGFLRSSGVDTVVIACNSASAAALRHLRRAAPDMAFVGMEPAVKPASEQTESGVVAVLATSATFQGELFKDLVGTYAGDIEIVEQACPGLAAAVEEGADPGPLLDEFLAPAVESGADVIVLGCTHYPLITAEIRARVGPDVAIIDPAAAVAERTLAVAREREIDLNGYSSTQFWTTSSSAAFRIDQPWDVVDIPADARAARRVDDATVSAVRGDITAMEVDVIVNAANVELRHGGGVALAIAAAGGPTIQEESVEWIAEHGQLEPGSAAVTSAGDMPASYVVHVAGPIYRSGQDNETLLTAAVFAALDTASELGSRSVAMPAISAGTYGYPPSEATQCISESVAEFLSDTECGIGSVRLVGYDMDVASLFALSLGSLSIEP